MTMRIGLLKSYYSMSLCSLRMSALMKDFIRNYKAGLLSTIKQVECGSFLRPSQQLISAYPRGKTQS